MTTARVYQAVPLHIHTTLMLDEHSSHHVAKVLRAQCGEHLVIFNGKGGEYEAVITHIAKRHVTVELLQFNPREAESPVQISLAQGLARGDKMDFIIQKAVELGVSAIVPLMTERCNVKLQGERETKRLQHWQSVIISACEQSGRNRLPSILPIQSLSEWLPHAHADRAYVLTPHQKNELSAGLLPVPSSLLLLVGPEGGLTAAEIKAARQQGFLPFNLGPRILRTETAPLAALSIMQYCHGDFPAIDSSP